MAQREAAPIAARHVSEANAAGMEAAAASAGTVVAAEVSALAADWPWSRKGSAATAAEEAHALSEEAALSMRAKGMASGVEVVVVRVGVAAAALGNAAGAVGAAGACLREDLVLLRGCALSAAAAAWLRTSAAAPGGPHSG